MTMRKKMERESEHESGVESEAMSEMDHIASRVRIRFS
jgi:hypothetical protein